MLFKLATTTATRLISTLLTADYILSASNRDRFLTTPIPASMRSEVYNEMLGDSENMSPRQLISAMRPNMADDAGNYILTLAGCACTVVLVLLVTHGCVVYYIDILILVHNIIILLLTGYTKTYVKLANKFGSPPLSLIKSLRNKGLKIISPTKTYV